MAPWTLQAFGFRQPIVVDAEGVIICGHTCWKAATEARKRLQIFAGWVSEYSATPFAANSRIAYGERSCDELGYEQRKLNFAIEPRKTQKRATKQRCEKNSRDDKTPLELFLAGLQGWDVSLPHEFLRKSDIPY